MANNVSNYHLVYFSSNERFTNGKTAAVLTFSFLGITALVVGILVLLQLHGITHVGFALPSGAIYGSLAGGGTLLLGSFGIIGHIVRSRNLVKKACTAEYQAHKNNLDQEIADLPSETYTESKAGSSFVLLAKWVDGNNEMRVMSFFPNHALRTKQIIYLRGNEFAEKK